MPHRDFRLKYSSIYRYKLSEQNKNFRESAKMLQDDHTRNGKNFRISHLFELFGLFSVYHSNSQYCYYEQWRQDKLVLHRKLQQPLFEGIHKQAYSEIIRCYHFCTFNCDASCQYGNSRDQLNSVEPFSILKAYKVKRQT